MACPECVGRSSLKPDGGDSGRSICHEQILELHILEPNAIAMQQMFVSNHREATQSEILTAEPSLPTAQKTTWCESLKFLNIRAMVKSLQRPAAKRPSSQRTVAKPQFPKALVINLARRRDRWTEVENRLQHIKGLDFERLEAVDGTLDPIGTSEVGQSWTTAANWHYVTRTFKGGKKCGYQVKELQLTIGERGCAASHVMAWQRCCAWRKPILVLEDDARPTGTFAKTLSKALKEVRRSSPHVLWLGYVQAAPWRRRVGPTVREAEYLWTTVAYILWPAGARKLLAELPVNQPVDNFMSHLMAARKLRGFAIVPKVVSQAKGWNEDNDVVHSDDAAWAQDCGA
eukprot:s178_g43.t1